MPHALRSTLGAALVVTFFVPIAGHAEEAFDLEPGTRVLAPILYRQLAVFPVVQSAAGAPDKRQYLTLTEGLQRKLVSVTEAGSGGQVNRVHVANRSDRPLLLLGGEVILGGQQDRILGKDTIIPAHEEAALEVFCVEHGRWNGSREFTSAQGMAERKVRYNAKFKSDQGQVWQEVAAKTKSLGAETSTGTYRSLATGAEGQKAVKPIREHVLAELAKLPDANKMVGVIAAVNGRVTSVDVFAKPELFAIYKEKLLDSIFVSVADVAAPTVPAAAPKAADIRGFIDKVEAAPEAEVVNTKKARTTQKSASGVSRSRLDDKDQPYGKDAKPIYRSYQAE